MRSALIVHSRHTKGHAKSVSKKYRDVDFLEVKRPPTEEILKVKSSKDVVVGIGGGSVIDTAKIISGDKRCIATPTTASGAAMTPYAVVWGKRKVTVPTEMPILELVRGISKELPPDVLRSTVFDALSHAIESFWARGATSQSKGYSGGALALFNEYLNDKDMDTLISVGNLAGQAIAMAGTNVVHSTSYSITIRYGVDHGTACGILLPFFVEYMDFEELPELFNLGSTEKLTFFLKSLFPTPRIEIKDFDTDFIADKAMEYDKINQGPRRVGRKSLIWILEKLIDSAASNEGNISIKLKELQVKAGNTINRIGKEFICR